jgi:hypothetical protein
MFEYFQKRLNEMFIAHASVPAKNPECVAQVLADIMSGEALPFPPGGSDMWMAWSGDGKIELEIGPRGSDLRQGADGATWSLPDPAKPQPTEWHLAIGVDRSASEIIGIASSAGWPSARRSRRGFFHVVEVWVEGAFMIEFLDPADTAAYKRVMTPANWKNVFRLQPEENLQ